MLLCVVLSGVVCFVDKSDKSDCHAVSCSLTNLSWDWVLMLEPNFKKLQS